jgi:hypothetical protein
MSARAARYWFAATALCAVAGIVISVINAWSDSSGVFSPGIARGANVFAYFTIESNLLTGAASALLAVRLDRGSTAFKVLRLTSLIAITVTGIVFHLALARLLNLSGWHAFANELVHTIVPIMSVVGWLLVGPRGLIDRRIVWMSLIFPLSWLAFTLIRGAITPWYPYPFIDVTQLGYARALLNCLWVAILMLGLAAGAAVIDPRLPGRSPAH